MRRLVPAVIIGFLAAVLPVSAAQAATFVVNNAGDAPDVTTADGICRTAGNVCTLRAAIQQAKANPGADTVTIPAMTITLGAPLTLDSSITLAGAGAQQTVLTGNTHVFVITGGVVALQDLAITEVSASRSQGLVVYQNGGVSSLTRVRIADNEAQFISTIWAVVSVFSGEMSIAQSSLTGNVVNAPATHFANGAALFVAGAGTQVQVTDSTIANNRAKGDGAAFGAGVVATDNATVVLTSTTVSRNTVEAGSAAAIGGNLYNGATMIVQNSIITEGATIPGSSIYKNCRLEAPITFSGRNIVSDTTCGAGNANRTIGDPGLKPLVTEGVDTAMRVPQPGSPVIDAGACVGPDQRGVPRPVGGACDLGAVEAAADLRVTLTGPAAGPGGTEAVLVATVLNQGPDPVAATLTVSGTTGGGTLGTLGPGQQTQVALNARVPAQVSAGVQGDVPDPVPSDNTASATITDSTAGSGGGTPSQVCAVVRKGTSRDDRLRGTSGGDRLLGRKGDDRIKGLAGDDCLNGGKGQDLLVAGPGADRVAARDGQRDVVRCGPGRDVVIADKRDRIAKDCERRRR